jgi:hypothetical protein
MHTYSIILHTGDDSGVDPAAQILVTLYGTKASSHELELYGPAAATGAAAAGTPSTTEFALVDLGDIQRVRVRHDDPGVGPGCSLDRLVVRAAGTLQEWTFPCHDQVGHREGGGITEHTLDAVA